MTDILSKDSVNTVSILRKFVTAPRQKDKTFQCLQSDSTCHESRLYRLGNRNAVNDRFRDLFEIACSFLAPTQYLGTFRQVDFSDNHF